MPSYKNNKCKSCNNKTRHVVNQYSGILTCLFCLGINPDDGEEVAKSDDQEPPRSQFLRPMVEINR